MAGKAAETLYDQFDPQERLALFLEAMARDDQDEAQRLKGSCPKKTYTMADAAYADRVQHSFDIVLIVTGDLRTLLGRIEVLEGLAGATEELLTVHRVRAQLALVDGWRLGRGLPALADVDGGEGEDEAEDAEAGEARDEAGDGEMTPETLAFARAHERVEAGSARATAELRDALAEAARGLAAEFLGTWSAFAAFSRKRLGVGPDVAVRAWCPPVADQFERLLKRYRNVVPVEGRADLAAAMEAAWARQTADDRIGGD